MKKLFFIFLFIPFLIFSQDLNNQLIKASKQGNYDQVVQFVSSGANVNYVGAFKWTSLMWAVRNDYEKIVKFLIEKGALLDLKESAKSAFDIAEENGFNDLTKLLSSKENIYRNIEEEIDVASKEETIKTPILSSIDQKGLSYFRVFAKVENEGLFFAIKVKYMNQFQENIGGSAYAQGKRFDTFSKEMSKISYKGKSYFVDYFTIIIDEKDFLNLIASNKDISFGIRRSKYDFNFLVPISVLQAISEKSKELNLSKKQK